MRIEFIDIKFKNFLSYGDNWNGYNFSEGINFIVSGNKSKSNAMGKSSCLKAISFVLFGKLPNINKSDIINWQNRKNCKVVIRFKRENELIEITRGLKPDILKIIINGKQSLYESDLKTIQKKIEKDIIGIEYDNFNNLVYCNPNNTISILNTSATKKRQFIENIFSDMTYFSDLMNKTNHKIKVIKSNVEKKNIENEFNQKNLTDIETELKNLNVSNVIKEYYRIESEYNIIVEKLENEKNNHKNIDVELGVLVKNIKSVENEISKINVVYTELKNRIKDKEIEFKNIKDKITDYEKNKELFLNINDIKHFNEKHKNIEMCIKKVEWLRTDNFYEYQSEILKLENIIFKLNDELYNCDFKYKSNCEKDKCPLCGSLLIGDAIEETKEKKQKYNLKRISLEKEIKKNRDKIENLNQLVEKSGIKNKRIENSLNKLFKIKRQVDDNCVIISIYDKFSIENYDDLSLKEKICKDELKKIETEISKQNLKSGQLTLKLDEVRYEKSVKEKTIENIKKLEKEIEFKKEKFKMVSEKKDEYLKRIDIKKNKVKDIKKCIKENENSIEKSENLLQYFEILKDALKDDNIKGYMISTIIPYLNSIVNNYLNEIGFDFFVTFDNFLNVSINGPGGRLDCSLGNMSGGEEKAIDMVTRFALMEISKLKAKCYPDILLLDEILDSSIDNSGIEKLINIIKYIQKKNRLKVFVVSHRFEVNEFINGKMYKINKKNQFSFIEG